MQRVEFSQESGGHPPTPIVISAYMTTLFKLSLVHMGHNRSTQWSYEHVRHCHSIDVWERWLSLFLKWLTDHSFASILSVVNFLIIAPYNYSYLLTLVLAYLNGCGSIQLCSGLLDQLSQSYVVNYKDLRAGLRGLSRSGPAVPMGGILSLGGMVSPVSLSMATSQEANSWKAYIYTVFQKNMWPHFRW